MKTLTGIIQKGSGQAGRVFALPTANIALPTLDADLKAGVYASRSTVDGTSTFNSITFIGQANLLEGKPWRCETHFFDISRDFVGKPLSIELLSLLREAIPFTSEKQAASMISKDIENARNFFKT